MKTILKDIINKKQTHKLNIYGFLNYMKKAHITCRDLINVFFYETFIFNEYDILSNLNNEVLDEFEIDLFFGIVLDQIILL